jgi:hypothetical protein
MTGPSAPAPPAHATSQVNTPRRAAPSWIGPRCSSRSRTSASSACDPMRSTTRPLYRRVGCPVTRLSRDHRLDSNDDGAGSPAMSSSSVNVRGDYPPTMSFVSSPGLLIFCVPAPALKSASVSYMPNLSIFAPVDCRIPSAFINVT